MLKKRGYKMLHTYKKKPTKVFCEYSDEISVLLRQFWTVKYLEKCVTLCHGQSLLTGKYLEKCVILCHGQSLLAVKYLEKCVILCHGQSIL